MTPHYHLHPLSPLAPRQHTTTTTTTMNYKLILLAALVVIATGLPQTGKQEDYPPANYNFQWEVEDAESGNSYSQQEARDGDNTEGRYEVLLPDGVRQVVVYSVQGENGGFQAEVSYE